MSQKTQKLQSYCLTWVEYLKGKHWPFVENDKQFMESAKCFAVIFYFWYFSLDPFLYLVKHLHNIGFSLPENLLLFCIFLKV